ncbi:hypothetical protein [Priestia megaterium]|uniref:hypothetical protein n=1 Tax=Priestia megaterium TaxID=1404 RepID=UPI00196A831B|nr:hypothetical protein [Priestia megaterium]QSF41315.1 hypothetical protein ICR96_11860 [Priestia megaterium]
MNFSFSLSNQIIQSIGMNIEVATDTSLFEGRLVKFSYNVLELEENIIGYERVTRLVFLPLSSVNFIRVQISQ